MSKKNNPKKMLLILGVLIVVLLIVKLKERKQGDRSFKQIIVQVDTSKVQTVSIYPRNAENKVKMVRDKNTWMMEIDGKKYQADGGTIDDLLNQINVLKPKRVAGVSEDQWETFEVTDSLGTRIVLNEGKKPLADFILGKFSYSQPKQAPGQNPYMQQQQQMIMTSYVRLSDEKETYAVDGYLSMLFNRKAESFRDDVVLNGDPKNWKKLVFKHSGKTFSVVNQNDKWMINGLLADSVKVDKFFSKARILNSTAFANDINESDLSNEILSLRVEGDNFSPIEIKAFLHNQDTIYSSSINKGNLFTDTKLGIVLFADKDTFIE